MSEAKKRLPGTILALGAVSFFTDASSEMIVPLLPAFVATLGAGALFLGALEGAADATASFLKLASGFWADKTTRKKPMVVLGYGLSSLARSLVALVGAAWHLLGLRIADRIGKGIRTSPRDVILASSVKKGQRGRAFGLHRAADHAGAVVGPLLALLLLSLGLSLRVVFAVAVIPALCSMLALVFWVREPRATLGEGRVGAETPRAGLPRGLGRFLVVIALFSLGNSPDSLLLLRTLELGLPAAWVPGLWAAFHIIKSLLSTPFGALSDRLGRRKVIVAGWAIYALAYTLFAFSEGVLSFCSVFLLYGCYYALVEGATSALIADLSPPERRGRAFGAYHATVGGMALPAGLLTGWLWTEVSAQVALGMGALCAGAASFFLFFLVSERRAGARD